RRHKAGPLDNGRDVRCAFHQGLLPGRRIRPDQPDHAQGRRACERCRYRGADGYLYRYPRQLLPKALMISVPEIRSSLTGAVMLAKRAPDALSYFDLSTDGFYRSFY